MNETQSAKRVCIVGAGLAGSLVALLLRQRRPDIEVHIFEERDESPPERTWSFHASDLPNSLRNFDFLNKESAEKNLPWVSHIWSCTETQFPSYKKIHNVPYLTVFPKTLWATLKVSGAYLHFSHPVETLTPTKVQTLNHSWSAAAVIDARGFSSLDVPVAFQKFVGRRLRLKRSHGLKHPILMDANVDQKEGYRFFYLLPFSETDLLVEDTRYSENSEIQWEDFYAEIDIYCAKKGFLTSDIISEESGKLPIPLYPPRRSLTNYPQIGVAGHYFHTITGYSAPEALKIADLISTLPTVTSASIQFALKKYQEERKNRIYFYAGLNRMLFLGAEPQERRRIFEHFYHLPQSTIERFYSGRTSLSDVGQIFSGRPPISISKAVSALASSQAQCQQKIKFRTRDILDKQSNNGILR